MRIQFTRKQLWSGLLLGILLFLPVIIWNCGFQAQISSWNEKGFLAINQWAGKNKFIDLFFLLLTYLGSGYVLVPLIGVVIWIKRRKEFWVYFGIFILILVLGGIAVYFLKQAFKTLRPLLHFQGTEIVHVLGAVLKRGSFPSGHAQTVFTGVLFLDWAFPKWRYLYWIIGILTGLSRCYVGVHFPLDVLAGFLVSLLCFLIVKSIFKRALKNYQK